MDQDDTVEVELGVSDTNRSGRTNILVSIEAVAANRHANAVGFGLAGLHGADEIGISDLAASRNLMGHDKNHGVVATDLFAIGAGQREGIVDRRTTGRALQQASRGKIDLEDVPLMESVGEIALVAMVVFQGRTNIPINLATFAEGGASIGGSVRNDLSAQGRERRTIEIELTKQRGMSRERMMDPRRTEQVEGQNRLRKETIPFGKRELGVDGAKNGDKMILERPNGTFGGIDAMFFWRNTLELDFVLGKGIFEVLGTLVVENVEIGRMAVVNKKFVGLLPGIANAGGLANWNGNGVNGIGVLMVENKNIIISTTGGDVETTSLIRIGL